MRLNRLVVGEFLQRIGVPGVAGLVLVAIVLALVAVVIFPAQRQLEASRSAVAVAAQRRGDGVAPPPRAQSPAEQLQTFYDMFPPEPAAADWLQKVYDAAAQQNLPLPRGEYSLAIDVKAGLARYRITLPIQGSYAQLRGFVAAALASVPTLSLDDIDFQRQTVGDAQLDAKVRMSLFLSARRP
jgi:hypothetical protein